MFWLKRLRSCVESVDGRHGDGDVCGFDNHFPILNDDVDYELPSLNSKKSSFKYKGFRLWTLAFLVVVLTGLVIGGIETNPGPRKKTEVKLVVYSKCDKLTIMARGQGDKYKLFVDLPTLYNRIHKADVDTNDYKKYKRPRRDFKDALMKNIRKSEVNEKDHVCEFVEKITYCSLTSVLVFHVKNQYVDQRMSLYEDFSSRNMDFDQSDMEVHLRNIDVCDSNITLSLKELEAVQKNANNVSDYESVFVRKINFINATVETKKSMIRSFETFIHKSWTPEKSLTPLRKKGVNYRKKYPDLSTSEVLKKIKEDDKPDPSLVEPLLQALINNPPLLQVLFDDEEFSMVAMKYTLDGKDFMEFMVNFQKALFQHFSINSWTRHCYPLFRELGEKLFMENVVKSGHWLNAEQKKEMFNFKIIQSGDSENPGDYYSILGKKNKNRIFPPETAT